MQKPPNATSRLFLSMSELRLLNEAVGLAAATDEVREAWLMHVKKSASPHIVDIIVMIWHGCVMLSGEHEAEKIKIARQFHGWAGPTNHFLPNTDITPSTHH